LAVVVPKDPAHSVFASIPQGQQLQKLLSRAAAQGSSRVSSRLSNSRATGVTVAIVEGRTAFAALTWARELIAECLRERPATLGVVVLGLADEDRTATLRRLATAAAAAAFRLPSFKTEDHPRPVELESLTLLDVKPRIDLDAVIAEALGNNIARWLTALPPNRLTAAAYRGAVEELAKRHRLVCSSSAKRSSSDSGPAPFWPSHKGMPNATRACCA
jgi:leucyl aminopeptidase